MLKSPSLFHKKFVGDIRQQGFETNPHDPCAANKAIDNEQMTMVWHVDDLKTSHKDPKIVTKCIEWLKEKCEDAKVSKIKDTREKQHTCLGMASDHASPGKSTLTWLIMSNMC